MQTQDNVKRRKALDQFYKKLEEFVGKLSVQYKEIEDLAILHTAIQAAEILGVSGKRTLLEQYKTFVYPYKSIILTKDEKKLLDDNMAPVINNIENKDVDEAKVKIDYFKNVFRSPRTTEETKLSAWNYLELLTNLLEIYEKN